jgi:hypothetical protein
MRFTFKTLGFAVPLLLICAVSRRSGLSRIHFGSTVVGRESPLRVDSAEVVRVAASSCAS